MAGGYLRTTNHHFLGSREASLDAPFIRRGQSSKTLACARIFGVGRRAGSLPACLLDEDRLQRLDNRRHRVNPDPFRIRRRQDLHGVDDRRQPEPHLQHDPEHVADVAKEDVDDPEEDPGGKRQKCEQQQRNHGGDYDDPRPAARQCEEC